MLPWLSLLLWSWRVWIFTPCGCIKNTLKWKTNTLKTLMWHSHWIIMCLSFKSCLLCFMQACSFFPVGMFLTLTGRVYPPLQDIKGRRANSLSSQVSKKINCALWEPLFPKKSKKKKKTQSLRLPHRPAAVSPWAWPQPRVRLPARQGSCWKDQSWCKSAAVFTLCQNSKVQLHTN